MAGSVSRQIVSFGYFVGSNGCLAFVARLFIYRAQYTHSYNHVTLTDVSDWSTVGLVWYVNIEGKQKHMLCASLLPL